MKEHNYIVDVAYNGLRIDKFLSISMEDKSRSYIQGLIEDEAVKVNNKIVKSNYKLKTGDVVEAVIPDPVELSVEAEDIPLEILYEDSDVLVVNKPQGMVVHPAAGNQSGTLVNAILNHCSDLSGINGVIRPGIVHRIDKDTSGVLVIAKNDNSHNKLAEQLKDHSMTRVYMALVEGVLKADEGTVDAPLARHPIERKKIAVVKDGRRAVTHYKVVERFNNATLVECRLETGRTHQIRVHMAHIGHPLVGDPVYGYRKQRFRLEGQLLHARLLGFIHPTTGEYMEFETPLPDYFKKVIEILRKELK
ncbi:RluA family pseudouridine synthase [Clostridium thermarum]|uniref:RluA family pseudouridine synthase n=1 Tax=Clostridium thermarum TaxID=1716543 RepID=UPI0013D21C5B|nr:RluA family pseudouridine synthase [Clostridium thermarum]